MGQKKFYITGIVVFILLITYLHYSTIPGIYALHDIYRELFYIPIFIGALIFGLKGAAATFSFIFFLYLPYIFKRWTGEFTHEMNEFLHLLTSLGMAIAKKIIEEHKGRIQIDSNTGKGTKVIIELPDALIMKKD